MRDDALAQLSFLYSPLSTTASTRLVRQRQRALYTLASYLSLFYNHTHIAPVPHTSTFIQHSNTHIHTYVISIYYYSYSKLYKVYPSCHPYRNTQSMLASLSSSTFAVPVYFAFVSNHVTDRSAILFYPLAASG